MPARPADPATAAAPTRAAAPGRAVVTAIAVAAIASMVVNAVIAAIARGPLDVSSDFQPLQPATYLTWTLIGTVVGGLVWRAVTRRSAHPAGLLRWLVPVVVVVSLVPDLLVYLGDSMTGVSGTAVWALVVMHLATAAISVPVFQRFMPAAD